MNTTPSQTSAQSANAEPATIGSCSTSELLRLSGGDSSFGCAQTPPPGEGCSPLRVMLNVLHEDLVHLALGNFSRAS